MPHGAHHVTLSGGTAGMSGAVNIPASVAARIRNWAKSNGRTYQHALARYATERFCARISASEYSGRLVLKGGNLFIV